MLNLKTNPCYKLISTGFVVLTLVSFAHSYDDFDDLDNLGDRISQSVNSRLLPLQGLGSRINADVQKALRPLNSGQFNQHMQSQMNEWQNSLSNLGEQIQQSVHEGLAPVRAMEVMLKMTNGVGGTTISTHSPGGRQFVLKNYDVYQCNGQLSSSGECNEKLVPFKIQEKSDYCFVKNKISQVNDWICIGADSVSIVNNNITCRNYNNDPVLIINRNEYRELCKDLSQTVEYRYIANIADPYHIKIPNENKYVKCINDEPNVCVFSWGSQSPQSGGNQVTIINSNV